MRRETWAKKSEASWSESSSRENLSDAMEYWARPLTAGSYLELVRSLIKTYTLEPAGSHGVWGLDDHSFVPFIFGSAQVAPPVTPGAPIPSEGSLRNAPRPNQVINEQAVRQLAAQNMYFAALTFIYNVKKGPFWEHSPMLYDISGIEAGWAKINKVSCEPSSNRTETDDMSGTRQDVPCRGTIQVPGGAAPEVRIAPQMGS